MKTLVKHLSVLAIIAATSLCRSQTLDGYIKRAKDAETTGNLEQATQIMEEALIRYPDNSNANSYLGLYLGMQAGRTNDFMEAGILVGKSFEMLNKAISLDPNNPLARFHRGLMGVNVPEFLGKLESGIKDLEFLIEMHRQSPNKVSKDILLSAYDLLGQGYQKKKEHQKARLAWEKVIELSPGTNSAEKAEKNIKRLSEVKQPKSIQKKKPDPVAITRLKQEVEKAPDNSKLLLKLGKAYFDIKNFEESEKVLKKAISLDSSNVEAYKWLVLTVAELAGKGYDERIHEDTDLRTNLAFELTRLLDKAVAIAPEDAEMRLLRGISGVQMPFFVGKLDQATEDLNMIINSNAPDSIKSEALFWLGAAYQKRAMTHWIKVVSKYADTQASKMVFAAMKPSVKRLHLSDYQTPFLAIDFVLGFRDELPPQTAVWIEDKAGKFVKTIYVSGFSGYAKEQQVNLPEWSESSKFADADAVTGASIDLGHYIYVWDLNDSSGDKVKSGEYRINVEVAYWPSMEYQLVSATIDIGKTDQQVVAEEGNLIPYLEVKYYPNGSK